jgi:2-oxoglutarate ferredoxin oxidoreductase subunit beta
MAFCQAHASRGEVVTGLLYIEDDAQDLHAHLNTVGTPLNQLAEADLCPGSKALDTINASYR